MIYAIIGLIGFSVLASVMSPLLRSVWLPRAFQLSSCWFWRLLILSLVANLFAFFGFHSLASGPAIDCENYHSVLEILALLSAGAIAGFWGVEYEQFKPDETHLINIISAFFVIIFYALFISICFYIGKSEELQVAPGVTWVVPGIMMLILDINALIDILDYRN